ncbi:MAG: RNA polymerase sigma factor [Acidobacteriia bacterium]|nr:RNA polymerase sigma factor [Terriglobia bacterium]
MHVMAAMQRPESDETGLVAKLAAGCEESWLTLYRRYQGRIFRFALQMSGSRALAEEATQETFLAFLDRSGRFDRARGTLGNLLLGIARNKTLSLLEKERPGVRLEDQDLEPVSGDAERSLMRQAVRAAVLALPEGYREVVVLCELEELDYAAAAVMLNCPVGTVRSRLHRARQMLAERLAGRLARNGPVAALSERKK